MNNPYQHEYWISPSEASRIPGQCVGNCPACAWASRDAEVAALEKQLATAKADVVRRDEAIDFTMRTIDAYVNHDYVHATFAKAYLKCEAALTRPTGMVAVSKIEYETHKADLTRMGVALNKICQVATLGCPSKDGIFFDSRHSMTMFKAVEEGRAALLISIEPMVAVNQAEYDTLKADVVRKDTALRYIKDSAVDFKTCPNPAEELKCGFDLIWAAAVKALA